MIVGPGSFGWAGREREESQDRNKSWDEGISAMGPGVQKGCGQGGLLVGFADNIGGGGNNPRFKFPFLP